MSEANVRVMHRVHANGMIASIDYHPHLKRYTAGAAPAGVPRYHGSTHDLEDAKRRADQEARCYPCTCPPWPLLFH